MTETQRIQHNVCPECDSVDTEEIETDTTPTGESIRRFACGNCYAGYEVQYQAVSKETYYEAEVR